jgi:hypothetical protein
MVDASQLTGSISSGLINKRFKTWWSPCEDKQSLSAPKNPR